MVTCKVCVAASHTGRRIPNVSAAVPAAQSRERDTLTTAVEQHFNQLTVFDPRVPHGVAVVEVNIEFSLECTDCIFCSVASNILIVTCMIASKQLLNYDQAIQLTKQTILNQGVREPTEARIVLHGWFTSSGPFFKGALMGSDVGCTAGLLFGMTRKLFDALRACNCMQGMHAALLSSWHKQKPPQAEQGGQLDMNPHRRAFIATASTPWLLCALADGCEAAA